MWCMYDLQVDFYENGWSVQNGKTSNRITCDLFMDFAAFYIVIVECLAWSHFRSLAQSTQPNTASWKIYSITINS